MQYLIKQETSKNIVFMTKMTEIRLIFQKKLTEKKMSGRQFTLNSIAFIYNKNV